MLLGLKPDMYVVTSIYHLFIYKRNCIVTIFYNGYAERAAITFYLKSVFAKNVFVWCAVCFHPKQTVIRKMKKLSELFRLLLVPTIITICLFFIEQKQFEHIFSMFRGKIFEVFYLK